MENLGKEVKETKHICADYFITTRRYIGCRGYRWTIWRKGRGFVMGGNDRMSEAHAVNAIRSKYAQG